jgi:hypothetical protein
MRTRYVIYLGEEIKGIENDLDKAEEVYNSLPKTHGTWRLRRSLVKETTILQDIRE